jgi:uncharacterized protein (TIGR03435 family)
MTPGRFHVECMTAATLVRTAYGYQPAAFTGPGQVDLRIGPTYGLGVEDGVRVRGGDDWVRSVKWSIEAIADESVDGQTMRGAMLTELLERRFQLQAHVDSEPVAGWLLVVAKGGLKIKPMADVDCTGEPASERVLAQRAEAGLRGTILITEAAQQGVKPTCGAIGVNPNGPNVRFEVVGQPPGSIARNLRLALGASVVDRTGITAPYLFSWEYGPDASTPGDRAIFSAPSPPRPRAGFDAPSTAPKAPPLFVALEQQLGLTLEPTMVPREFIVIDHIARPSAN